jgi:hypothetical protein
MSYSDRRSEGLDIRNDATNRDYPSSAPDYDHNGEEDDYRDAGRRKNFIANYSKSLPHHHESDVKAGEVIDAAYQKLLEAVESGQPRDFEDIPLGSADPPSGTGRVLNPAKLTNPLSGLAFDLEGIDSNAVNPMLVPPAPRIDRRRAAGEMAELYWMALCRDINFKDFDSEPLTNAAIADLSSGRYTVPSWPTPVTAMTLFRGETEGDKKGPYISQFLLKGSRDVDRPNPDDDNKGLIKFGSLNIDQRQLTVTTGSDYMADYIEWLDVQDGKGPPQDLSCGNSYDLTQRLFIRNMRDLANYVHYDDLPQQFINACLILLHIQAPCVNPQLTFDPRNPYVDRYQKQVGFGTFGPPHFLTIVTEVTTRALKACWFQKWFVHRRLRPEAFGALIHRQLNEDSPEPTPGLPPPHPDYPIHPEILESEVLHPDPADPGKPNIFTRNKNINQTRYPTDPTRQIGSYLLPQAFPEGSPTHPSYPAGHATIAGACVTILKAFFDEGFPITSPVQANADGTALELYPGPDADSLTVGGELNKLASNISLGRNMAGVHYRSDHIQSLRLGEEIAISILRDQKETYRERYRLRLTKFDGTVVTIGN